MKCVISGSHVDEILWIRDGHEIPNNGGIYSVTSTRMPGYFQHGQKSANQSMLTIKLNFISGQCNQMSQYNGNYYCKVKGHVGDTVKQVQSTSERIFIKCK